MKTVMSIHREKTKMRRYTGTLYIPFDIEITDDTDQPEDILNYALDTFGQHEFGQLSWDNPNWSMVEVEEDL